MSEQLRRETGRNSEVAGSCIRRETVPLAALSVSDDVSRVFKAELDPRGVEYFAESLKNGKAEAIPVLVKAHTGEKDIWYEVLHRPGQIAALSLLHHLECSALVLYGHDDFRLSDASPDALIALAEAGTKIDREEDVEVVSLVLEGKITDQKHEDELGNDIGKKGKGQRVRIWVRAREENGRIVYDIIDGYHRSSVLARLGLGFAKAIVSYGMTDEELYDQRVIAANSVASVQFARVVRSMQRSFIESKWYREYHLKLSTVLGWAYNEVKINQPGRNTELTPKQVREAIEWGRYKAALWQGELGTIYQQIRAAEYSFDEIIEQVRSGGGGGKPGSGVFNPGKFIALAEELQGDLHLQRMMVEIIKAHNPDAKDTVLIAKALHLYRHVPVHVKALKQDPVTVAHELLGDQLEDEPKMHKNKQSKKGFMNEGAITAQEKEDANENPSVLSRSNAGLRGTLFEATGTIGVQDKTLGLIWLDIVPGISNEEKKVMTQLFVEGQTPEAVCVSLHITENKLWQWVSSAQKKFAITKLDGQFMEKLRIVSDKK